MQLGVFEGKLAHEVKPPVLWVEMDSKLAHDLIVIKSSRFHLCADVVKASLDWEVSFHHIFHEANRFAYLLANLGHYHPPRFFSQDPLPGSLLEFLRNDIAGISFPRHVI